MRNKSRLPKIYRFFKENDKHLAGILNLDVEGENFKKVKENFHSKYEEILFKHLEYPDLRFGQHLINLAYTPEMDGVYYIEEIEYLIRNECFKEEELISWTSFGINGDEPPKTQFLNELTSDHIKNILKTEFLHRKLETIFKRILTERGIEI